MLSSHYLMCSSTNFLLCSSLIRSTCKPMTCWQYFRYVDHPRAKTHTSWFTHVCSLNVTWYIFISHFSGPDKAIGRLCLSVCLAVWMITFQGNDLWLRYLATWFIFIMSWSSSKVKVTGQSSSHGERVHCWRHLANDINYHRNVLWLT